VVAAALITPPRGLELTGWLRDRKFDVLAGAVLAPRHPALLVSAVWRRGLAPHVGL